MEHAADDAVAGDVAPGHPVSRRVERPVIESREQLADYLDTCAGGRAACRNPAQFVARDQWVALRGDDAGPAFDLAQRLNLPLLCLSRIDADPEALRLLPPDTARKLHAVPLLSHRNRLAVAIDSSARAETLSALDFASRQHVVPVVATAAELRESISRFYDTAEDWEIARQLGLDQGQAGISAQDAERLARETPVVRLMQGIIAQAVYRRASDIHLRPGEQRLELLFRIDDELLPVRRFPGSLAPALVSRIKVLAGMNLAEHRTPQDGRVGFVLDDGRKVDLRVSIMPSIHGESVVVRLLDTDESLKTLDQIGLTTRDRQLVDDLMNRSHGMFLATGPTGCGKSTTLYAMLLKMRSQRINILTIEDPVELRVEGVQQMQVNRAAGFGFATAMRNFLRHDPDAIMVGEIRDRETAAIAVESALTGHLVLSTLHTNTAATAITRMLDLGVEAFLLRASLMAVMAQRLVRLNCQHCLAPEIVDPHVRETMGVDTEEVFQAGRGCAQCSGLGVFRRSAVYELLIVTPDVCRLIVPGAEADRIHAQGLADGMVSITQAALAMARSGRISLQEAYRVRVD